MVSTGKNNKAQHMAMRFALIVLSLILAFSFIPAPAYAASAAENPSASDAAQFGETQSDASGAAASESAIDGSAESAEPVNPNGGSNPASSDSGGADAAESEKSENRIGYIYNVQDFVDALTGSGDFRLANDLTITDADLADSELFPAKVTSTVHIDLCDNSVFLGKIVKPSFITVRETGDLTIGPLNDRVRQIMGGFKSLHTGDAAYQDYPLFDVRGGKLAFNSIIDGVHSTRFDGMICIFDEGALSLSGGGSIQNCHSVKSEGLIHTYGNPGKTIDFTMDDFSIVKCTTDKGCLLSIGGGTQATITNRAGFLSCGYWGEACISVTGGPTTSLNFSGNVTNCGYDRSIIAGKMGPVIYAGYQANVTLDWPDATTSPISNVYTDAKGALVVAEEEAEVTMKSGVLSGNGTGSSLGQVYVDSKASFTLDGGTIVGNKASTQGACANIARSGAFIMKSGKLQGSSDCSLYKGGLVYSEGVFIMSGGTLDAKGLTANQGGLIYCTTGKDADTENVDAKKIKAGLLILGGTLKNGSASRASETEPGQGGAIYVAGKSAAASIRTLSSNDSVAALAEANGIVLDPNKTVSIADCNATEEGGAICADDGASVYVGSNVEIDSCHAAPKNFAANGIDEGARAGAGNAGGNSVYTTRGGAIFATDNASVHVMGNALITNCSTKGSGSEKGDLGYGGGVCAVSGATFELGEGAKVSDCFAQTCGGGIFVDGAKCILHGEVTENNSDTYAGGIYVRNSADTRIALGDGACVKDNACALNEQYANLFLDYYDAASSASGSFRPIDCVVESLTAPVYFAFDPAIVPNTGRFVLSEIGAASIGFVKLDDPSQDVALIAWAKNGSISLVKRENTIYDRASLERAISIGGEWPVTNDIDLTGANDLRGYTITNNLTLYMGGRYIIADTSKIGAPLFTVKDGGTLSIGIPDAAGEDGGLRGCATADNYRSKPFHCMVLVSSGGRFNLYNAIENSATSAYREGAAVGVATDPGTLAKDGYFYGEGCTIRNCYSNDKGGAIDLLNRAHASLKDSAIYGAAGAYNGACVRLGSNTDLTASGTKFYGANCTNGGCIYVPLRAELALDSCELAGATTNRGGCIYVEEASASLKNTKLSAGRADTDKSRTANIGGEGGGIYSLHSDLFVDKDCVVTGCHAEASGGGIYWYGNRSENKVQINGNAYGNYCGLPPAPDVENNIVCIDSQTGLEFTDFDSDDSGDLGSEDSDAGLSQAPATGDKVSTAVVFLLMALLVCGALLSAASWRKNFVSGKYERRDW